MVGRAEAAAGCMAAAAVAPGSHHCYCHCPVRCHTNDPKTDLESPLPGY